MADKTLGSEIHRLRQEAGYGLREFGRLVSKSGTTLSAAHLSDIEHDRRRPSDKLLEIIVDKLKHKGADLEEIKELDTRLPLELQEYTREQPAARKAVYEVYRRLKSGRSPEEVLKEIQNAFRKDKEQKQE